MYFRSSQYHLIFLQPENKGVSLAPSIQRNPPDSQTPGRADSRENQIASYRQACHYFPACCPSKRCASRSQTCHHAAPLSPKTRGQRLYGRITGRVSAKSAWIRCYDAKNSRRCRNAGAPAETASMWQRCMDGYARRRRRWHSLYRLRTPGYAGT